MQVCMYVRMYVSMYACMYLCMHVCMYVTVCMYVCKNVCIHECMYVRMCVYVCIIYMFMCVFIHALALHFAGDEDVTKADIIKLEYLEQALKESMRLKPVGPVVMRRALKDDVIDGHVTPAGTNVIMNLAQMHRRTENFPSPDSFDPDHFTGKVCQKLPMWKNTGQQLKIANVQHHKATIENLRLLPIKLVKRSWLSLIDKICFSKCVFIEKMVVGYVMLQLREIMIKKAMTVSTGNYFFISHVSAVNVKNSFIISY